MGRRIRTIKEVRSMPRRSVWSMPLLFCILLGGWGIARGDDWPQWLGPNRDGVWRETGILDEFPKAGPKVLWRTPVSGGYSGPAVASDRVFLTDRLLAPNAKNPDSGFTKNQIPGKERVLCLDDATGQIVWTHAYDCTYDVQYPSGPRTTP